MATYDYVEFFRRLEEWGLMDALLPFLFIFVIVFAVLFKTQVLGKSRKFSAVVAFTVAMFVIIPHITGTYPEGWDVVAGMQQFLPGVSAILVALVMMLILIGLFGGSPDGKTHFGSAIAISAFGAVVGMFGAAMGWWERSTMWLAIISVLGVGAGVAGGSIGIGIGLAAIVFIGYVYGGSAGYWHDTVTPVLGDYAVAIVVMLLVIGIVIAVVMSDDKLDERGRPEASYFRQLNDNVGGFFFKRR